MAEKPSINSRSGKLMLIGGITALIILSGTLIVTGRQGHSPTREMKMAYQYMDSALNIISRYCRENGINRDFLNDPEETGMIGPELTGITTTAGDPAAKRTTLNPAFASLMVRYLREAGVQRGDTIAIGSSGSFPALMIASLSASRAMELEAITIISIGSSSFGASNPDFTILDIYRLLQSKGWITKDPDGVTLGGEMDGGEGFEMDIRIFVETHNYASLHDNKTTRLAEALAWRDSIYFRGGRGSVKAFINAGGSFANLGTSAEVLKLKPGLIRKATLPPEDQRGMVFSMLARDIPVIHLLNIREIARNHLPWDSGWKNHQQVPGFKSGTDKKILIPAIFVLLWFGWFLYRFRMLDNS